MKGLVDEMGANPSKGGAPMDKTIQTVGVPDHTKLNKDEQSSLLASLLALVEEHFASIDKK